MEIKIIAYKFSVCKIKDLTGLDLNQEFCFVGKTDEEISLVCIEEKVPDNNVIEREDGWKAFRIQGILDFSMVGILSKISTLLADNQIGIFAISTYNTDYILTKEENYSKALEVLKRAGYKIEE
jgi:uncharacterized protein